MPETFGLKGHIQRGDMAPWWNQGPHRFIFDAVAGRCIVLCFFGTAGDEVGQNALRALHAHRRFADDGSVGFFGVSSDPADRADRRVDKTFSSVEFVWDYDATMRRAYGVGSGRLWIVLDRMLRVIEAIPFRADAAETRQVAALIESLTSPERLLGFETPVPVLILPDVFEPAFCRHLIDCYERHGGRESGFMQEVAGKALEHYDPAWKRRKDYIVTDEPLIEQVKARLSRRAGPMLRRTFQFQLTRMERHLVGCYAAEDGGHFGPHRDDTVKATEHRRFAVTINLNDDFDGGELNFPEFGERLFKAPVGAALIFSASLLHRVSRITRGRRYAFLPFLHDEEAERTRLANLRFLAHPG